MTSDVGSHGVTIEAGGHAKFRFWAPACRSVAVELTHREGTLPMTAQSDGWHELVTHHAQAGSRYRFVLPDGMRVPDPASRFQPEDVHGPSEIVDLSAWSWSDNAWRGRPWEEAVIYELHVGTFTPDGTFLAAIQTLDHLVELGVTAIELMPIGDFAGQRNWGYDGVLIYAPDSVYGRPEDLKAFIEASHARGLMVLLDVVYNHFGPEGNYLSLYAPQFFTKRHKTPWGDGINFDGEESGAVREFFVQNALYWIRDFHFDGLRLDAVHAIVDDSATHILTEIAQQVRLAAGDRHVHLILENEENQARLLERGANLYTAQWNDDVHHVLHTAITNEARGYYGDYRGDPGKLGRALAEGFAFQGEVMQHRNRARGEKCDHLPSSAFVAFLQNHDQIGNRAFGDRITTLASAEAIRAAAAVYLLLPQIPMLFMGEEWNTKTPFPFFCDFGPDLAEAVRKGRSEEFAHLPEFQDPAQRQRIPDPQAVETFLSAKLRWDESGDVGHSEWLSWYRNILTKRRETIVPLIPQIARAGTFELFGDGAVLVRWTVGEKKSLVLRANLSNGRVTGFSPCHFPNFWKQGNCDETTGSFEPWSVLWSLESDAEASE